MPVNINREIIGNTYAVFLREDELGISGLCRSCGITTGAAANQNEAS